MIGRHYYRCLDCLNVAAVDELHRRLQCGACGGTCEHMGRVGPSGKRLAKDVIRCKCDDRCVCALGPSCDCKCGGVNHGLGLLGYVESTADAGAVPVLRGKSTDKLRTVAGEFRHALAAISAEIERTRELPRDASGRMTWANYKRMIDLDETYRNIKRSRSHSHRMAKAYAALPELRDQLAPKPAELRELAPLENVPANSAQLSLF